MKVWLVEHMDYDNSGIAVVAVSKEAAIKGLKDRYGPPYKVEWQVEEDTTPPGEDKEMTWLFGRHEAVAGHAVEHIAEYTVFPLDLVGELLPGVEAELERSLDLIDRPDLGNPKRCIRWVLAQLRGEGP